MSAPVVLEGPYESGSAIDGEVELFLSQDSTYSADTDTQPMDIPGFDDDDTILAPIEGERSYSLSGEIVPALLLSNGYSGSERDVFVEWIYEFESLCSSEQGQGYKLEDNVRNRTFVPDVDTGFLVEDIIWTHDSTKPQALEWRTSLKKTEGVQPAAERSEYVQNQIARRDTSISEDKITFNQNEILLGEISERRYERSIDINIQNMLHSFNVPTFGMIDSGVSGELTLDGRITDKDVPDLKQTSADINELTHGVEIAFEDALTQRSMAGAIGSSSSTFNSGVNRFIDYQMTITLGDVVV